jgi:hypothetical protein
MLETTTLEIASASSSSICLLGKQFEGGVVSESVSLHGVPGNIENPFLRAELLKGVTTPK